QFKKFHDKEAAEHFLNGFATVKVVADVEASEGLDWGDTSDDEILDAVKLFESTQSIKIDGKVNLKNVELIARSVRNKMGNLCAYVSVQTPLVLGLVETWVDGAIPNARVSIPGYRLERRDRVGKTGGGCL
ncbi:unnamed protein product, partial [Didymodactylos carnosus]